MQNKRLNCRYSSVPFRFERAKQELVTEDAFMEKHGDTGARVLFLLLDLPARIGELIRSRLVKPMCCTRMRSFPCFGRKKLSFSKG